MNVSASEMPTICGAVKASYSRAQLWRYKTGEVSELQAPNPFLTTLFEYGKATEPVAINWYITHNIGNREASAQKTGIWLLEDDPMQVGIGATPDLILRERMSDGSFQVVPIEIKCPYKDCYVWTPEREEKDKYQLMTQMACMKATHGYLLYFIPPDHGALILVRWDQALWDEMYAMAWNFRRYVLDKKKPPPLSKARKQTELQLFTEEWRVKKSS